MPRQEAPKSLDIPGENTPSEIVGRLQLSTCFMLANEIQSHGKSVYEMIKMNVRIGPVGGPAPQKKQDTPELNKFEIDFLDLSDRAKMSGEKWRYFSMLVSELVKQNRSHLAIQLINALRQRSKEFTQSLGTQTQQPKTPVTVKRTSVLEEVERILDPVMKKGKPEEGKK